MNSPDNKRKIYLLIAAAGQKGINLRQAAEAIGIDKEKAKNWIKNTDFPSDDELCKLCEYLDCSLEEPDKKKKKAEKPCEINHTQSHAVEEGSAISSDAIKDIQEHKNETPQDPIKTEHTSQDIAESIELTPKNTAKLRATSNATKQKSKQKEVQAMDNEKKPAETLNKNTNMEITDNIPKYIDASDDRMNEKATVQQTETKRSTTKKVSQRTAVKKAKLMFSETNDVFIRKAAGLKKSDAISGKEIIIALESAQKSINETLGSIISLSGNLTSKVYNGNQNPKLKKLIEIAQDASDADLDLAIAILERCQLPRLNA